MSRIGKKPIEVPASVSISISPGRVMVNGPLGELSQEVPQRISVEQRDGELVVARPSDRGEDRALHGLARTLVANMVEGVTRARKRGSKASRAPSVTKVSAAVFRTRR